MVVVVVRSGASCVVGAEFLAAAGGDEEVKGYYYEVEVQRPQGALHLGFAGTNFGRECVMVGADELSWSIEMTTGCSVHRCVQSRARYQQWTCVLL